MTNTKQCSKCKEAKPVTEFNKDKRSKDGFRWSCKSCEKRYREANKEKIAERDKRYREANKEKIAERSKRWHEANKEKIAKQNKRWREANKEKIAERSKRWREANKEKIAERNRRYIRKKRNNDPAYKLRHTVSNSVHRALKSQRKQKRGSTFEHLPYTPKKLKEHIESLWEPWMNWDNWGPVSKDRRTWQVDHIIPQSHLIYDSLQHPNFQKCWALSNLRPICAWENLEKGDKLLTEEKEKTK